MSPHGKKMIAPVVITIIFLLYLFIYWYGLYVVCPDSGDKER